MCLKSNREIIYHWSTGGKLPQYTFDVNSGIGNFSNIIIQKINSTGSVPAYALVLMSGDAYKPSGTTWNVASDIRIKENIVDANLFMCYNTFVLQSFFSLF